MREEMRTSQSRNKETLIQVGGIKDGTEASGQRNT